MTLSDFASAVQLMRDAQRAYFRCEPGAEKQQRLIQCKALEAAVDQKLRAWQQAQAQRQPELFEDFG